MKIQKLHKHTKLITTLSILVVATAGYGVYAYQTEAWPFLPTKVIPTEPQSTNNDSDAQPTTNDSGSNTDDIPDKQTPKQYETPSNNKSSSGDISGTLNANIAGGNLQVRVTIAQLLDSGSCKLTLTNRTSGATVTKTADVINNPSSASCKGWDIPLSSLPTGTWNIDILVTSNGKSGRITGEVNT